MADGACASGTECAAREVKGHKQRTVTVRRIAPKIGWRMRQGFERPLSSTPADHVAGRGQGSVSQSAMSMMRMPSRVVAAWRVRAMRSLG